MKRLGKFLLVILAFILLMFFLAANFEKENFIYEEAWSSFAEKWFFVILRSGMPLLGQTPASSFDIQFYAGLPALAQVDMASPKKILRSQLIFLDSLDEKRDYPEEEKELREQENKESAVSSSMEMEEENHAEEYSSSAAELVVAGPTVFPEKEPLVGIYNTHNAETYLPTHGVARLEGENGGVVEVARTLQEELEKQGIGVVRSTEVHDYPSYELSYGNSEVTAQKILQENPGLKMLLDVHRDAGLPERQTVNIEGKEASCILFIVGSDARWNHPQWRDNYAFALRVSRKMEEMYPGLSRGVRVQNGRYNQHLHPRALLLEIGCTKNSLEEAKWATALLADVLKTVLKELMSTSSVPVEPIV